MKKEQFDIIMNALETRITSCKIHLDDIHTTKDLSAITLARAAELKKFCIEEEAVMTNIVMVDLYHIIGMGNLSPTQMMKFTYTIQEYLEYRPIVKSIVKHLDSIMKLPKIPVKTQYKLQGLGGLTLVKGDGFTVDESFEDALISSLPFSLEGRTIKVDREQLEHFTTLMATINKTALSYDTLKNKCYGLKEYVGIQWNSITDKEIIGTFKSNDIYNRVNSYYNKRKMDS